MSCWVPPRLRPVLGADLDAVDIAVLERLIGFTEDTDLEFKRVPWGPTDADRRECALDVADKANAGGALIIIGAEEGEDQRLNKFVPVQVDYDLGLRIHQIAAQRISPPPSLIHRAIDMGGGQIHLLAVTPTTRPPHGVAVGDSAFRFPMRSGPTRRFLSEPELADWYQRRFQSLASLKERLNVQHDKAIALAPEDGDVGGEWAMSWLVITAVPEFQGRLELRRGLPEEWADWIEPSLEAFPGYHRGTRLYATPAFRSLRLHDISRGPSMEFHSVGGTLELDGAGSFILGHRGGVGSEGSQPDTSMVYDEHLVADIVNACCVLAQHSSRSGASGNVAVAAELLGSRPMVIGQYRQRSIMSQGQLHGTHAVLNSTGRSEHTAALDSLAAPGPPLVDLARLVATDLLSAFGLPEVQQIALDGEFVRDRFMESSHRPLETWAESAGVAIVPSWSEP